LATPGEHLEAARKNAERVGAYGKAFPGDGWAIVMAFYGALHLVDGYLLTKDARFHSIDHGQRRRAINAAPELGRANPAYRALQSLSEQVRYDACFKPTPANFESADKLSKTVWAIVEPKLKEQLR
jgi:hypothetical protein